MPVIHADCPLLGRLVLLILLVVAMPHIALPEGTPDGPTPLPSCAACPDRAAPLCALPQGNVLAWSGYIGVGGTSVIPERTAERFGLAYFAYDLSKHLKRGHRGISNLDNESGVEVFDNWAATP